MLMASRLLEHAMSVRNKELQVEPRESYTYSRFFSYDVLYCVAWTYD